MVVIAIISILAVVAIPAYNNYSIKSKFTEVVVATAPTRTAIAACAATGDCIVNNAIFLGTTSQAPAITISGGSAQTVGNSTPAAIWAYSYAAAVAFSSPFPTQSANTRTNDLNSGAKAYYITDTAAQSCLAVAPSSDCVTSYIPLSSVTQYFTAANNPYYTSSYGTPATQTALPCVGLSTGCSPATKYAASVSYDTNGVITATAVASAGLNQETFVLTPAYSAGRVDWSVSGTCKTRAGGSLC